jgi:tRNA G18 (ribose-2'-O)-methylase SpoU
VRQLRGPSAIGAALEEGLPLGLVLVEEGADAPEIAPLLERLRAADVPVRVVTAAVIRRMTSVGPRAGVLALVGRDPAAPLEAALAQKSAFWLLVGSAYPSNAGMVIRTAEGSGAAGIAIDADWDHTARRSALRTSMRADWYMPVYWESASVVVDAARGAGYRVFGIENTGSAAPWEADLTGPSLFIVGGEAHGIPEALLAQCDTILRLPMAGFIPSYNLQAAVSFVAVERLRQLAAP